MTAKITTTKQMGRNLTMNIFSFIVNVVVGLWLVPYQIKYLGVAAYGLIPLAMIFTDYIGVINVSVNSAISRFYLIEVQKKNWHEASRVFSTAFFGMLFLIALQIPILGAIAGNLQKIVNVPPELVTDAVWLFGLTFGGYLISLLSSILNTSMFANNRLDLSRTVDILKITVKVAVIVLLFSLSRVSLQSVGIAIMASSLATLIFSYYWSKKLTPNVKIRGAFFDFKKVKDIFSMGGWLIVNQVGYLLFLKIDILLVNKIMGAEAGGEYAAISQWNNLIRTFAGILSSVFTPVIMIHYAHNSFAKVITYTKFSIKYLTLIMVMLCGIIAGFGQPLLSLWLGEAFADKSDILAAMILPLAFAMGTQSALAINQAYNKVKIPGIITLVTGILNFITSYLLLRNGFGFMGIALSGSLWLFLKNTFFTPIYAAHVMKLPYSVFMKSVPLNILIIVLLFLTGKVASSYANIHSWFELAFYAVSVGAVFLALIWIVCVSKEDKARLKEIIKKKQNIPTDNYD